MVGSAIVLALGVTGCAQNPSPAGAPPEAPSAASTPLTSAPAPLASAPGPLVSVASGGPKVHSQWVSCAVGPGNRQDGQDALTLPRLTDSFPAVSAVICDFRPTRGTKLTPTEKRTTDVTALLTALRLPDEAATAQACTQELPFVPWLILMDAQNRWIRPGVPVDSCGKPRQEFRDAYRKLLPDR
ncbi:hypothetical protein ADL15_23985 [Actinoplanes awajinensis subsp. mycoplanecinus]|uniref:Uncharacterized protein n=2 Tax=Actinoplanes awajinensis TaxID=135946 RepID=A0A101JQ93_9ACTN|nr:hypothetical protein ADL15_23985 [Actinoplanes awajinensis subsp. mycoplanecinus]